MPRRAEITPRALLRDPVYESVLVTQVVNRVMQEGKKSVAENIVYKALESVGQKTGQNPVEVLERAIKSVTPVLEVRSRRVGGAPASTHYHAYHISLLRKIAALTGDRSWAVVAARWERYQRHGGCPPA